MLIKLLKLNKHLNKQILQILQLKSHIPFLKNQRKVVYYFHVILFIIKFLFQKDRLCVDH